MEKGWLIEQEMKGEGTTYLRVYGKSLGWTVESRDAVRFSRKVDAEAILRVMITEAGIKGNDFQVAEHQWGMYEAPMAFHRQSFIETYVSRFLKETGLRIEDTMLVEEHKDGVFSWRLVRKKKKGFFEALRSRNNFHPDQK